MSELEALRRKAKMLWQGPQPSAPPEGLSAERTAQLANVGDAIAEYCARNGDEGVPADQAEAVRFIGREVSTLRAKLAEAEQGEAERQRAWDALQFQCGQVDPLWGPPPSAELIAAFHRANDERQRQIALDALVEREAAIRRAQRESQPVRENNEPKP